MPDRMNHMPSPAARVGVRSLALLALALLACAAPQPAPPRAATTSSGFREHALDAAAQASRARAAAADADGAPGVVRGVQLRVSGISARDIDQGQDMTAGVRVLLDRPWRVRAEGKSGAAARDAETFAARAAELRARAFTCDESVQGRAEAERQVLARTYAAQLAELLAWTVAFRAAGTIDPVTASRTELLIARRLLADETADPVFRIHDSLGTLPAIEARQDKQLDRHPDHIVERIRTAHPSVQEHLSRADQHGYSAAAELGERIPWLSFVQLDYGIEGQGVRDLQGRLALEIPLDDGSRGRSRSLDQLSESERYEAESEAALLNQQASIALHALTLFENQSPSLAALEKQANDAEALSLRFMGDRREGPDKVAQLLAESYAGRLLVLEARERAGRASCSLAWATGVSASNWPRVSATAR